MTLGLILCLIALIGSLVNLYGQFSGRQGWWTSLPITAAYLALVIVGLAIP